MLTTRTGDDRVRTELLQMFTTANNGNCCSIPLLQRSSCTFATTALFCVVTRVQRRWHRLNLSFCHYLRGCDIKWTTSLRACQLLHKRIFRPHYRRWLQPTFYRRDWRWWDTLRRANIRDDAGFEREGKISKSSKCSELLRMFTLSVCISKRMWWSSFCDCSPIPAYWSPAKTTHLWIAFTVSRARTWRFV